MFLKNTLLLLVFLTLIACVSENENSESTSSSVNETFDFTGMIANYADEVIIPSYQNFSNEIKALNGPSGPIATYCNSIGQANEASDLETAQIAWRSAMTTWQGAETILVGPALDNGGQLRNKIYSFFSNAPLSACAVDQAVVLAQDPQFDILSRSNNQRGMDTLEYLLFNNDLTHNCPAQIVETQNWNALSLEDRANQRCDFAKIIIDDIEDTSEDLVNAWAPTGNNYRSTFIDPNNISTSFESLSDALFYIELEAKDAKLGIPTGINNGCSELTCIESAESSYSDSGLANIKANLNGFKNALTGINGLGFDDIVAAKGFSSVTQEFLSNVTKAINLIDSMDDTLLEQVQQIENSGSDTDCLNSQANPEGVQTVPVCSLHGYLKRISDSLRTEFITIVDVDLPTRAGGDND